MIRKSTWEVYFNQPKAFSLPSNWQELGAVFFFFLLLCHFALVSGTTWSIQKEKEKKLLHLSSSTNYKFSLKAAVQGGTCVTGLRACRLPVTRQGEDRRWGPPAPHPWFPSHPTLQLGTFSISSPGKAGNELLL